MTELLTAAQMRAIEEAAINSGEVTGLELMERAGRGVVEAIFEEWPDLRATSHRAVVLCGPGNNGGDGFVVARLLHDWGWEVEVFLYGGADKLPPDGRANYERWLERGVVTGFANSATLAGVGNIVARGPSPGRDTLVVDAIFGTGVSRPPEPDLAVILDRVAQIAESERSRVVAVDVPSGLCADSGRGFGENAAAAANLTVTFHRHKVGHFSDNGALRSGKLSLVNIGLEGGSENAVDLVSQPGCSVDKFRGHKFTHGHALILSGPAHCTGAARLAARGALRIGAGLVTVAAPGSALMECASQLTSIMLTRCDDGDGLRVMLKDQRINALCLGPGLGVERARGLAATALEVGAKARPVVIDADALTAFADDPPALFAMLHGDCVLTPHEGEFKRLFPDIHAQMTEPPSKGPAFSKVDASRAAAARAGCVVLFKGPDTVIAAPDGRAAINSAQYDRAAPWLATAGAGDVLAGFITGLLARGFDPMQAAATAAWLHVECALDFGPGLIAEDLPAALPAVFRKLGL